MRSERARQKSVEKRRKKRVQRKQALKAREGRAGFVYPLDLPPSLLELPKMSEALLFVADIEPEATTLEQVDVELRIAAMVWNVVLANQNNWDGIVDELENTILPQMGDEFVDDMRELCLAIARRKIALFANDPRSVIDAYVEGDDNGFRVHAAAGLPVD